MSSKRKITFIGSDGGFSIRVILVLVTLLAVGGVIYMVLNTVSKRQEEYHRKAVHMSEEGLERALQKFGTSSFTWKDGFEKTYIDEEKLEWYEVTIEEVEENGATVLVFESTGGRGSVINVIKRTFERVIEEGDTLWRPKGF
ncbi:MAG: hypothetical protein ACOC4J_06665 [Bacteroidota bacterium]